MTPARPPRIGFIDPQPVPVSPQNWSGTPRGLYDALTASGVEVVPIGCALPVGLHQLVALLSRRGGRRGPLARRAPVSAAARSWEIRRRITSHLPLDAVIATETETYDLGRAIPDGLPVATYDDGTFATFARHPDSDLVRDGFPPAEVRMWAARQGEACRAATVCCVSTGWAGRSVVEDYGVPAERVAVVGMGHRPRAGAAAARDWDRPTFLFVGVDWGRKNGAAVLTAFAEVRSQRPDAVLHLVGEHPPVVADGVLDHGLLRRDDAAAQRLLDELYATATAFVLPSRFDPSPIAYLEAASAGLPVIATTEGGASELLGDAAITVHPDDHAALVEGMLRLTDPDIAQRMGAEAVVRAADASWTKVAARILASLGLSI